MHFPVPERNRVGVSQPERRMADARAAKAADGQTGECGQHAAGHLENLCGPYVNDKPFATMKTLPIVNGKFRPSEPEGISPHSAMPKSLMLHDDAFG